MLSPLRRQSLAGRIWNVISPAVVSLAAAEVLTLLVYFVFLDQSRVSSQINSRMALTVTALSDLAAVAFLVPACRKDRMRRRFCCMIPKRREPLWEEGGRVREVLLFGLIFLAGMGLSEILNILASMLTELLKISADYSSEKFLNGHSFLPLFLLAVWLIPFSEEFIFRQMIYLRLRDRMRPLWAALISALMFGVFHGSLQQGLFAGAVGFFAALSMECTGSLLGALMVHAGANFFSVLILFSRDWLGERMTLFYRISLLLAGAVVGTMIIERRLYAERRGKRLI